MGKCKPALKNVYIKTVQKIEIVIRNVNIYIKKVINNNLKDPEIGSYYRIHIKS